MYTKSTIISFWKSVSGREMASKTYEYQAHSANAVACGFIT